VTMARVTMARVTMARVGMLYMSSHIGHRRAHLIKYRSGNR
jgi:hypothetical protein